MITSQNDRSALSSSEHEMKFIHLLAFLAVSDELYLPPMRKIDSLLTEQKRKLLKRVNMNSQHQVLHVIICACLIFHLFIQFLSFSFMSLSNRDHVLKIKGFQAPFLFSGIFFFPRTSYNLFFLVDLFLTFSSSFTGYKQNIIYEKNTEYKLS